ncbi:MAG: hypothetical protein GQ564_11980 [Bacteroidales bacterium]|nr:hypothetical protein [Bacteroidales bacterium]
MAVYKSFAEGVEVNGQTILSVVKALSSGQDTRLKILKKYGIDPEPDKWYSQQAWLDAFKEISTVIGDHTLFMIGKSIPENATFPPEINNIEMALNAIDQAYHMNHQGGEIGHYKLIDFDEIRKSASMACNNPYPSGFDRGIITTMVRKFRPKDSFKTDVTLDTTKETRTKGAESCTFKIAW